jgi:hypothetical protein
MNKAEQSIAARPRANYLTNMNMRIASETGSWWRARFIAIARQAESARPHSRPGSAARIRPWLARAAQRRVGAAASRI